MDVMPCAYACTFLAMCQIVNSIKSNQFQIGIPHQLPNGKYSIPYQMETENLLRVPKGYRQDIFHLSFGTIFLCLQCPYNFTYSIIPSTTHFFLFKFCCQTDLELLIKCLMSNENNVKRNLLSFMKLRHARASCFKTGLRDQIRFIIS